MGIFRSSKKSPAKSAIEPQGLYRPFQHSDEIRVLLINPCSNTSAPIQCSLEYNRLRVYNEGFYGEFYTALSYVWGDANDTRNVLVNNHSLKVTANLECALRNLRHPTKIAKVWADAVCINQADLEERSHQVELMSWIYRSARLTVVFLGESDRESTKLLAFAEAYAMKPQALSQSELQRITHAYSTTILNRPWFTRVWTLQEFVLTKAPWVQCGQKKIPWEYLFQFDESLHSLVTTSGHGGSRASFNSPVAKLDVIRQEFLHRRLPRDSDDRDRYIWKNLLDVIIRQRGMGVSDPKDMIYAQLSLPSAEFSQHIELHKPNQIAVDYRKSVRDIYTSTASRWLAQKGDFCALVEEIDPDIRHKRYNLPSWVPDWTSRDVRPWPQIFDVDYPVNKTWSAPPIQYARSVTQDGCCQILDTEFMGSVVVTGGIVNIKNYSSQECKAAWQKFFPNMSRQSNRKAASVALKQHWCKVDLARQYLNFIGLLEAVRSVKDETFQLALKELLNPEGLSKFLGIQMWDPDEVTEQHRGTVHPFVLLMLSHMSCMNLQILSPGYWEIIHSFGGVHNLFTGRRFCLITTSNKLSFADGNIGLVPSFSRCGDIVRLIQRGSRDQNRACIFRESSRGDVSFGGKRRYILVGRSYFHIPEPWGYGQFMQDLVPPPIQQPPGHRQRPH